MLNELKSKSSLTVIGLMSGTSLDGTDLCACTFSEVNSKWEFKIMAAETIPYSSELSALLRDLPKSNSVELIQAHATLGRYYGVLIVNFIQRYHLQPDLIGSHGHTIFHQPDQGFTFQIGDGQQIAAVTGVDTIYDFRSKDIGLGGQGAPLVPIGDQLLFSEYSAWLNIGGIANISFEKDGLLSAFDICPANMALNYLSESLGFPYDEGGKTASTGVLIPFLLEELNQLSYYAIRGPKSIGREWFENNFLPLIHKYPFPINDQLRTVVEHIAIQIAASIKHTDKSKKLFVTGGGAFNNFLIERIKSHSGFQMKIPDDLTIAYKEAIIFAFLAVLFVTDHVNILGSATGAPRDHIGGAYCKAR